MKLLRLVPGPDPAAEQALYARRVRLARSIVLCLAGFVVLTLVVAVVFGVYNYTTDRPAKTMFGIAEH